MSGHRYGRGLYKDSEDGVWMGVCAGLANYFDLSSNGVRMIVVLLALFMFWPVFLTYVVAGFLLRHRPLRYSGRDERDFWRRNSTIGRTH
ncbi:MAG: PspC domain-containing protein [Pseudomonadota bacterium]